MSISFIVAALSLVTPLQAGNSTSRARSPLLVSLQSDASRCMNQGEGALNLLPISVVASLLAQIKEYLSMISERLELMPEEKKTFDQILNQLRSQHLEQPLDQSVFSLLGEDSVSRWEEVVDSALADYGRQRDSLGLIGLPQVLQHQIFNHFSEPLEATRLALTSKRAYLDVGKWLDPEVASHQDETVSFADHYRTLLAIRHVFYWHENSETIPPLAHLQEIENELKPASLPNRLLKYILIPLITPRSSLSSKQADEVFRDYNLLAKKGSSHAQQILGWLSVSFKTTRWKGMSEGMRYVLPQHSYDRQNDRFLTLKNDAAPFLPDFKVMATAVETRKRRRIESWMTYKALTHRLIETGYSDRFEKDQFEEMFPEEAKRLYSRWEVEAVDNEERTHWRLKSSEVFFFSDVTQAMAVLQRPRAHGYYEEDSIHQRLQEYALFAGNKLLITKLEKKEDDDKRNLEKQSPLMQFNWYKAPVPFKWSKEWVAKMLLASFSVNSHNLAEMREASAQTGDPETILNYLVNACASGQTQLIEKDFVTLTQGLEERYFFGMVVTLIRFLDSSTLAAMRQMLATQCETRRFSPKVTFLIARAFLGMGWSREAETLYEKIDYESQMQVVELEDLYFFVQLAIRKKNFGYALVLVRNYKELSHSYYLKHSVRPQLRDQCWMLFAEIQILESMGRKEEAERLTLLIKEDMKKAVEVFREDGVTNSIQDLKSLRESYFGLEERSDEEEPVEQSPARRKNNLYVNPVRHSFR